MTLQSSVRTTERPGRPLANPDRDTRALLIRAATELFAEQGVAATTLTTIARRAGLTPAMVHYHFKDRDQLVDAVVDERLAPLISYVWSPLSADDDPATMLVGVVERLLEQIERAPWIPSTWMREVLNENGLLRSRLLRRLPFDKISQFGQAIASAQANSNVNPNLEPLLVVFSALGLVMVHMATRELWTEAFQRPPLDRKAIQRHIAGLMLHGLVPSAKPVRKVRRPSTPRRKS